MKEQTGREEVLKHINRAWESTCKSVLGGSVGPIERYEDYLWENVERYHTTKSALSGKEVIVTGNYPKEAKFISGEEIEKYTEILGKEKLNINEMKDIDSILEALGERIYYSGNDVLGNSAIAADCNRVINSTYVYKAHDVFNSKYVAYTYLSKLSDYIFGCESVGGYTHHSIKSFETYDDTRMFETVRVSISSDIVYSSNLQSCKSCLFSFNLRAKNRCIGNVELPEDKFKQLREKLLEDIRQTLETKKTLPSIMEIIGGGNV